MRCDDEAHRLPRPVREPTAVAYDRVFNDRVVGPTRTGAMDHAVALGLPEDRAGAFVIAVMELVVNAIRHGRGVGRIRMWRAGETLYCQISDRGPGLGMPGHQVGTALADPEAEHGRGLWIVRHFCDDVDIVSAATGTTVTVTMAGLPPDPRSE